MAWYTTGTAAVTNGSLTVTGTGTAWVANADAGQGFLGPDLNIYEIASVNSDTSITLARAYAGSTQSGQSYAIVPIQGYTREAAIALATLIAQAGGLINLSPNNDDIIQRKSGAWTTRSLNQFATDLLVPTEFRKDANGDSGIRVRNESSGTSAKCSYNLSNGISSGTLEHFGHTYTTSGVRRQHGTMLSSDGAGGLTLGTTINQPVYFVQDNTEIARIQSNQFIIGATTPISLRKFLVSNHPVAIHARNEQSNPSGSIIMDVDFSAATPNNATEKFMRFTDSSTTRIELRSNGGIGNYQANNQDLSDEAVKGERVSLTAELDALEGAYTSLEWEKFKYVDQTHDDWNIGITAQKVERAFPALVDAFNPVTEIEVDDETDPKRERKRRMLVPTPAGKQLKGVYTHDLMNIAHALLGRALKDLRAAQAEIQSLRARVDALESR